MFKWLRKIFPEKKFSIEKEVKEFESNFGSVDVNGNLSEGYMVDGKMVFRPTGKRMPVWGEPVYHSVLTLSWQTRYSRLFGASYTIPNEKKVSLYKQTNKISGQNRYFYEMGRGREFIDANAYEKNNVIVFLDEGNLTWET